jgi:peptidoglycan hydrolase CwlO-like protein
MTDLIELRSLAMRAFPEEVCGYQGDDFDTPTMDIYQVATPPSVIINLLDQIDSLEAELAACKKERDHYKDEAERIRGLYESDIADFTVEVSKKEVALDQLKVWLENKTIELAACKRERDALLQQRADILENQSELIAGIHKSYALKAMENGK